MRLLIIKKKNVIKPLINLNQSHKTKSIDSSPKNPPKLFEAEYFQKSFLKKGTIQLEIKFGVEWYPF